MNQEHNPELNQRIRTRIYLALSFTFVLGDGDLVYPVVTSFISSSHGIKVLENLSLGSLICCTSSCIVGAELHAL
jgi:hypothetical protein